MRYLDRFYEYGLLCVHNNVHIYIDHIHNHAKLSTLLAVES